MGSKNKSKQSSSSQNVNSSQGVNSGVGMNYGVNQSGNYGMNTGSSNNFGFNQGISSGVSDSSNFSQSNSSQSVWGGQSPYLTDVYGKAQSAFNDAQGQIKDLQPQVQDQLTQALAQAQGGMGNQMGGGFSSGLQGQVGPNAYVNPLAADMMSDAAKIKQQNLGALDARAAAAGMSGSSGYRDQVTSMADNIDEQTMQGLNQLRFNAQNQGVQNQMNLANMMDRNQQFGVGNLQNIQQGAMNQFNPAMMGQQSAALYGQTIGGPTVLGTSSSVGGGGSTSTNMSNNFGMNTGQSNNFGVNTGFSNGMNAGMNMSGGVNNGYGYGASNGQGSSSGWSFSPSDKMVGAGIAAFSDVRLKENIKHVDQIDGINMYTWDWKDEEMSWPMNYGVIAQEVAQTHPDAVTRGDHGYLMVDYSKLGRAGEMALARMEG